MSLKVWISGTTDLKDQGVSITNWINHGTSIATNGKLGKCLNFNGSSNYLIDDSNVFNKSTWTICAWVYTKSTSGNQCILCTRKGIGYGISVFFIGSVLRIDCGTNNANCQWSTSYTVKTNEWFHLCIQSNGSSVSYYINGNLMETHVITSDVTSYSQYTSIGASHANNSSLGNYLNGMLNDVRIYDNALTLREIKNISQGLVLHYTLSAMSGENLIKKSYYSSAPWKNALSSNVTFQGKECMAVAHHSLYSQNINNVRDIFPSMTFEENTQYTMSIEWGESRTDDKYGSWYIRFLYTDGTNSSMICSGTHDLHKSTLTSTAGKTVQHITTTYGNGGTTYFCNFKIEKGTKATPYTPAPEDMFMSDGIEYDVSGHQYNGTQIGTFTYSKDTSKHLVSTQFNGVDNGILISNIQLSNIINTAVTYSFWIKPSGENGARSVYFGSYSGNSWSIEKTAGNLIRGYWNGNPDVVYSGATITDNTWQHICITKNGTSDIKVYINGILKATSTTAHNNISFPTTYRIGRDTRSGDGTPYKGLMSDFRIYATALSADEVKYLYDGGDIS